MVSSYRPSTRSSEPLTKEQMLLEAKIHKAEELMRKRDEKIQSLTEKAGTLAEAERIRRDVMKHMRINAEKYMETRKRQWQKQSFEVSPPATIFALVLGEGFSILIDDIFNIRQRKRKKLIWPGGLNLIGATNK